MIPRSRSLGWLLALAVGLSGGDAQADGDAPKRPEAHARDRAKKTGKGLVASFPSFAMREDGGSRLTVRLSGAASVEERHAGRTLTYAIKGARIGRHNDTHPLVTLHFNTPLARARLVAAKGEVRLVVELRADAAATQKVEQGPDGATLLAIDFPKGEWLAANAPKAEAPKGAVRPAEGPATLPDDGDRDEPESTD